MINNYFSDLHTHSNMCNHGLSSLTENIEYAHEIGLKVYGYSEHQYDEFGIGAHRFAFNVIQRSVPSFYKGMRILKGIELNITDHGFEYEFLKMDNFDYAIASMHNYAYSSKHTKQENTANILNAINDSYVKILGHIDQPYYPMDYDEVVKQTSEHHVLIELNNSSLNPKKVAGGARENDEIILTACIKYNCPIIVDSDAHIKYDIGNLDNAFKLLTDLNFPKELVCNLNEKLFNEYFKL